MEHRRTSDEIMYFKHEGDCGGSLCSTCECCIHCYDNCGCQGCTDSECWCSS